MRYHVPVLCADGGPRATRWEEQTVEVAEVSEAEAPVVVRMPSLPQRQGARDWRSWNGRLWQRSVDVSNRAWTTACPFPQAGEGHPLSPTHPHVRHFYRGLFHLAVGDGKISTNWSFADSRAMVDERAAATIAISGEFYQLSPGPLAMFWMSNATPVVEWGLCGPNTDPSSRATSFSLLDAEQAREIARIATGRDLVFKRNHQPQIVGDLPEGFFDVGTNAVEGAAANILFHLRGGRLNAIDRQAIPALIELRECYASRWPHMKDLLALNEGQGWLHEFDRIDFPDATELAGFVLHAPEALVDILPEHIQIRHRIAVERISRDPRFKLERDEDLDALEFSL